jgi:hypothetical protein
MAADPDLKTCLLLLAREALQQAQAPAGSSRPAPGQGRTAIYDQLMPGQGGMAFYNPMRDAQITGLSSFAPAVTALQTLLQFLAVADPSDAKRVVLQFTYDFLERQSSSEFEDGAFAATWSSFQEELARPEWNYLGICYLENFESDADAVELGDGVRVHHRSSHRFRERGWSDFQIEKLYENWRGRGLYVLVVEEKVPKSPDNLILGSTGQVVSTAFRMLGALRLANEGDVHIGGGTRCSGGYCRPVQPVVGSAPIPAQ